MDLVLLWVVSRSARLAPLAEIAGQHLERLDGSGYPRGLSGAALSPAVRLLAAHAISRSTRPSAAVSG
jgi:HD-GYP domain-containing protein (c-di-GMP phosphodiesterase class II)